MYFWVKCPYCGESDMMMISHGTSIASGTIRCVNLACPGESGLPPECENPDEFDGRYLPYPPKIRPLWEILVPTIRNDGTPIRTRFHRVWDEKVRGVSGGLTILTPAKGQWINSQGRLFTERMIPVRILATRPEIETIVDMTMKYYDQEAILAYKISDEVILKEKKHE